MTIGKEQVAFGSKLRVERERRGLTLQAIANSTKIKQSLLAGLERGDVSHWPAGLFRRAYLRDYASAIGLSPEPLVEELRRLFPEDEPAPQPPRTFVVPEVRPAPKAPVRSAAPRSDARSPLTPLVRVRAAVFDVGAIVVLAAGASLVTGFPLWLLVGMVAFGYVTVATVAVGRGFGAWVLPQSDQWFASDHRGERETASELGLLAPEVPQPAVASARRVGRELEQRTRRAS